VTRREPADCAAVLEELRGLANPANVAGMARFGISPTGTLGISIPSLRKIARRVGRDHELARCLWASGVHEARILAAFVDEPALVTDEQLEAQVRDLDSWDVCDQWCMALVCRTPFAQTKIVEWAERPEEFVRRAAFAVAAALAGLGKKTPDGELLAMLPLIEQAADDPRNFVKKAVSWALRGIGKRNRALNAAAIATAERLAVSQERAARWVGNDALRELRSEAVQSRLG
jgi:3-methyladenine DNA glycosylase AlkD